MARGWINCPWRKKRLRQTPPGSRPAKRVPIQARSGRTIREYVKGAYAVGTASPLIVGWSVGSVQTTDIALLPDLRQQAQRYGPREKGQRAGVLMADKGFDGRTARREDLIPLMRRRGNVLNPKRLERAELVSAAWKRSIPSSSVNSVTLFVRGQCVCNSASRSSKVWSTISIVGFSLCPARCLRQRREFHTCAITARS